MGLIGEISGLISSRFSARSTGGTPATGYGLQLNAWMASMEEVNRTASGENINEVTAVQQLDVYACVRVLAEAVGTLRCGVWELLEQVRKEAVNHDLYDLLALEPNPETPSNTFWETMTGCCALTGNAYAEIRRNAAGRPAALYQMHPHRTRPFRLPTGTLAFETTDGGAPRLIAAEDMLHFKLWSMDGLRGLSPIGQARQSLGIAMATERFGGRFFANGGRPSGVLSSKLPLNDKQVAENRAAWQAAQGGENQGKTAVLSGDWTYESVGMSPEEAQFLETRKYSRTQTAGLFRVPPHMIGDTTRLSNANHEQESLSFVTEALLPYLTRFQVECTRKLFPRVGRSAGRYFVEFDLRDRLRADFKTTHEALALGRQWGWYTANKCLTDLGENPVGPEGDVLLYPINMGNAKALLDPAALKPPSAAPDKPAAAATPTVAEPQSKKKKVRAALPPEIITPPSTEERMALAQCTTGFIRIFTDATGRVSARQQKDAATVTAAFEPALRSILDQVEVQAQARFNLRAGWHGNAGDKIVADHLKSIAQRAQAWTPDAAAHNAGLELNKAIRAIALHTYRDAGAAVALEGVEHAA